MNLHDKADKEHYITTNTVPSFAQKDYEIFENSEVAENGNC